MLDEAEERGETLVVDLVGHDLELLGRGLGDELDQRHHVRLHQVRGQLVQNVLARGLCSHRTTQNTTRHKRKRERSIDYRLTHRSIQ